MGNLILIVEDNEMNLILIRDLLQMSGYTTVEAGDGKKAIEIAQKRKPDLILMDIQLPILDGFEATKILKSDKIIGKVPVVALTAAVMEHDRERIREVEFDGYIQKPIDVNEFLGTVAEYLDRT